MPLVHFAQRKPIFGVVWLGRTQLPEEHRYPAGTVGPCAAPYHFVFAVSGPPGSLGGPVS